MLKVLSYFVFCLQFVFIASGCSVSTNFENSGKSICENNSKAVIKKVALLKNNDMEKVVLVYGHYALGDGKAKMKIYPAIIDYYLNTLSCVYSDVKYVDKINVDDRYDYIYIPKYSASTEEIEKYSKGDVRLEDSFVNLNEISPTVGLELVDPDMNRIILFKSSSYVENTKYSEEILESVKSKKTAIAITSFPTLFLSTAPLQISIGNDYAKILQSNVAENTAKMMADLRGQIIKYHAKNSN